MSKIGKKPIAIPEGVTVEIGEYDIRVKSPKGEMSILRLKGIDPKLEDRTLSFQLVHNTKQTRSNWGTLRALVQNAIEGLTKGFEKKLVLEGIGYRITKEGNSIVMNLGFSHPVKYEIPAGTTFEIEKNSILTVKGFDKALVGQVAAEIRAMKKPEPYKGTGFHYAGEVIRRKAGKKTSTTSSGA